jgi:hypothetical protein
MARKLVIQLTDELEEKLIAQAEQLHQSPEALALYALTQQLVAPLHSEATVPITEDPLLKLIGSIDVDIPDLAENHDDYIGQALYRELRGGE